MRPPIEYEVAVTQERNCTRTRAMFHSLSPLLGSHWGMLLHTQSCQVLLVKGVDRTRPGEDDRYHTEMLWQAGVMDN